MANPICNLSADLNKLTSAIGEGIGDLLNFSGLFGTPAGLLALQARLASTLATIGADLSKLLPDIPFSKQFESLADGLTDLANGVGKGLAFLTEAYGDVQRLIGSSITDLANAALGAVGGLFNPCGDGAGIPNIARDLATGQLIQRPNIQINRGLTNFATSIALGRQVFNNPLSVLGNVNVNLGAITNAVDGANALKSNVMGSITGMGNVLKKLPSGEQIFQTQDQYIAELKQRGMKLLEQNKPKITTTENTVSTQV